MKLEIRGVVLHSNVFLVEAGNATYIFTFAARNPAVVEAVARTTLGTFRGTKSKRPFFTTYNIAYYGTRVVIFVLVALGCIYAATRKRQRPLPQPPWAR
jgi:hypothetical protein